MRNQSRPLAAALCIVVASAICTAEAADDPVLVLEGRVAGQALSLSRSEVEALGMVPSRFVLEFGGAVAGRG